MRFASVLELLAGLLRNYSVALMSYSHPRGCKNGCSAVDGDTEGAKGPRVGMRPASVPAVESATVASNLACRPL